MLRWTAAGWLVALQALNAHTAGALDPAKTGQ